MRYAITRTTVAAPAVLVCAILLWASAGSGAALAQGLDSVERLGSGTGLRWPARVVSTSDGSLAFVLNEDRADSVNTSFSNAVASFRWTPGALVPADLLHAGAGALEGLEQAVGIAVSPDDRFLYLGAMRFDRVERGFSIRVPVIVTLAIQPEGGLEFRSRVELDASGWLPSNLVPSPDGRHLYALVAELGSGPAVVAVFERNRETGSLRQVQEVSVPDLLEVPSGVVEVSDLEIAPDGEHLYLLARAFAEATLLTLDRAPETGRITGFRPLPMESTVPEVQSIAELSIDATGTFVFASLPPITFPVEDEANRLLVFRRDFSTGDLLAPRVLTAPTQVPAAGTATVVSSDDLYAYQCLGSHALQVYRVDLAFGSLEPVQTLELPPLEGNVSRCDHPRLSPDGRVLYVSASFEPGFGTLTRLRRDPSTGEVAVDQVVEDGEGGLEGVDHLATVVVSPDGRQVYAVREGWEVLTFRRDPARSGRLEPIPGGTVPLGVDPAERGGAPVLSQDGRHLYVGFEGELVTLARNPATGTLRLLRRSPPAARALTMSPDGRFLYAKTSPSTVTAYARNRGNGELNAFQTLELPTSGSTAVGGLALGPEGSTLYVATSDGSATATVAALGRNPADGRLHVLGQSTIDAPFPTDSLSLGRLGVTPDGRHVYLIAFGDEVRQIRLLDRDPEDGSLVPRSSAGRAVAFRIAPDGRTIYTLFRSLVDGPDEISALLRDPQTGELSPQGNPPRKHLGIFRDFRSSALSPDGANLYAVGDEGISVFSNRWFTSPGTPGFRFQVSIDTGSGRPLLGRPVAGCVPGTTCVQGAVAGRTEALMRIVGPKPNGRLWPTLVKFSTSPIEIQIDQLATGSIRTYPLEGASPGSDTLPGLFDREGFAPTPGGSGVRRVEPTAGDEAPPPPVGEGFTSGAFPGFRFHVRLTAGGEVLPVRKEPACFDETLCLSGAVPGRSEIFLRLVGPKPNGRLWPTLVRTTTSTAEIWIEQESTGQVNYYRLEGAVPGSTDLSGQFDRDGFLP